jgi:hypothetical protein
MTTRQVIQSNIQDSLDEAGGARQRLRGRGRVANPPLPPENVPTDLTEPPEEAPEGAEVVTLRPVEGVRGEIRAEIEGMLASPGD